MIFFLNSYFIFANLHQKTLFRGSWKKNCSQNTSVFFCVELYQKFLLKTIFRFFKFVVKFWPVLRKQYSIVVQLSLVWWIILQSWLWKKYCFYVKTTTKLTTSHIKPDFVDYTSLISVFFFFLNNSKVPREPKPQHFSISILFVTRYRKKLLKYI